jgi:hypothetical protein
VDAWIGHLARRRKSSDETPRARAYPDRKQIAKSCRGRSEGAVGSARHVDQAELAISSTGVASRALLKNEMAARTDLAAC